MTRYVAWLRRRSAAIVVASALVIATSGYLVAFHLPLRAAFSYLLPADAPSVRAFDELGQRLPSRDRNLIVITAPDAATRASVAAEVADAVRRIEPDLVEHVETDDAEIRAFVRDHRDLYAPLADLEAARAALAKQIARANPLYVDLDDDAPPSHALDEVRANKREADARLAKDKLVSADGRMQAMVIHTAFIATDVDRDYRLQRQLDAIAGQVRAAHPGVEIGFTGGITNTVAEHRALVHGVLLSTLITGVLVAVVLFVHLRSVRLLALLVVNIGAATLAGFGIAALTVGHLNAATAFLGAIVAGNGVNYGILLVARFSDERRTSEPDAAMARAIAGTLRPTLVASLGAAIAYGALAATRFRGFADFAIIGGVGMLVCWVASFVLLPALVLRFAHTPSRAVSPLFGRVVRRAFGFRRPAIVCAACAAALVGCATIAWRYLDGDPYEYDMTKLRSQSSDAVRSREWMQLADRTFERGLAGLASQTYIAVDDDRDVPAIVAELRAQRDPIIGRVSSIVDAVPSDQAAKLAVIDQIRAQIDKAGGELDDLRPPDGLRTFTAADLPAELRSQLTERDGHVGRIVAVRPGASFDELDGRQLIHFASAVRHVRGKIAGGSLLFADVLLQIQKDGPLVTGIAALGLVVMVVVIVGRTRRAVAVLAATASGTLAMIAVCAVAGLKINFLDFVALPITLGLGVDYAINVADGNGESTAGSVLVCSLTTIIGYTSLLVSDNMAIRGFGVASLIGEITCVVAALVVVPAIMAVRFDQLLYGVGRDEHVDHAPRRRTRQPAVR